MLQSNIKIFSRTGWIDDSYFPCPTMNLADFETIFDLLEHPVQILHYITRRTELESSIEFFGCELDILGLYFDTLLNNIETNEYNSIIVSDMSREIDKYYESKDININIEKPKPKISKLFNDIFLQLEKRSTKRWSEIGVILNMFSPEDQIKLSKFIKEKKYIVNKTWNLPNHENMIIFIPPICSQYALVYVMFKNGNRDKRYNFFNHAASFGLEHEHVKYCLVIGKNIDDKELSYHYIALAQR